MRLTTTLLVASVMLAYEGVASASDYTDAVRRGDATTSYEILSKDESGGSSRLVHMGPSGVAFPLDRVRKPRKGIRLAGEGPAGEMPEIYGWDIYSKNETPYGLYRMEGEAFNMVWADTFYDEYGTKVNNGFLKDGKIIGLATRELITYLLDYHYVVYDFETGKVLESKPLTIKEAPYYESLAYNPDDGYAYGIGKNYQYGEAKSVFMRSKSDDFTTSEVIAEIGSGRNLQSICYSERDNAFYGVNASSEFVRVDVDGTYTPLFTIDSDFVASYRGALLFSQKDNLFYWNYSTEDSSFMATIDDITQNVEVLFEIEHANEFSFFVTPDEWQEDMQRPEAPELEEASFPQGALSGKMVYRLPTKLVDGTVMENAMRCVAIIDGEQSFDGEGSPGELLEVGYTDLKRGFHTFGFYVSYDGHSSAVCQSNIYIGHDYPLAPRNVVMDPASLRWDAVTEGENGGYIDSANIEYSVSVNGKPYGSTKETHLDIALPADEPLAAYTASVVALNAGLESEPGYSNRIVAGEPLGLPVFLKPTLSEYELCTVADLNGDNVYWIYGEQQEGFLMGYSLEGSDCDDWLFLPPFEVTDADNTLSLEYEACVRSAMFNDEELEVRLGRRPDAYSMTQTIVGKYRPEAVDPKMELKNVLFNVAEAGTYYIGFHLTSRANQMGVVVKNVRIEDNNITEDSPAAVTDISAKAADKGVLEATATFTLPVKTVGGGDLPSDAVLKAKVSSAVETIETEGKPGDTVSVTVRTVQGDNILKAFTTYGDMCSPTVSVTVYTGVWAPLHTKVTSIKVSPDMMQATITWNPVTEGVGGKFIVPEDVTYDIYVVETGPLGSEWVYYDSAGKNTEYTYVCPEEMAQQVLQIGVLAINEAGNDGYVASARELVGTPLALPMTDSFGNDELSVDPWVIYKPSNAYDAQWKVGKIEDLGVFDTDAVYGLYCLAQKDGSQGMIGLPRFSTIGCDNVKIVFDAYVGEDCADIKVTAAGHYSTERVVVGTISPIEGSPNVRRVEMQLPAELLDQYWVQVYLEVEYDDAAKIVLVTNLSVEEGVAGSSESADISVKSIYGGLGMINVTGFAGETLRVSSADGLCVMSAVIEDDSAVYVLPRGIYIVTAGMTVRKVVVR